MATTVKQSSVNPSPKLNAAVVAGAAVSMTGLILRNIAPSWYDPDVMAAILPVAIFLAGYFTHDTANIQVTTDA